MAGIVDPFDTPPAPMDSRLASRMADADVARARLGLVPTEMKTAQAGAAKAQAEVALKKLEFEREKRWLEGPDYKAEARRRLELQARTGLPILSVDFDPNRRYLADPKEYAAAVGRGQQGALVYTAKQNEALKEVLDLAVKAQGVEEAYSNNTPTGGVFNLIPGVGTLRSAYDANANKIQAAKVAAKRELKVTGDVISNYDAQEYNKAAPGLDKTKEYNLRWAQNAKEVARRAKEYQGYREAFIGQNGSVYGVTDIWELYSNAHPIYAMDNKGNPIIDKTTGLATINPNHVSWQQFFMDRAKTAMRGEAVIDKPAPTQSQTPRLKPVSAAMKANFLNKVSPASRRDALDFMKANGYDTSSLTKR